MNIKNIDKKIIKKILLITLPLAIISFSVGQFLITRTSLISEILTVAKVDGRRISGVEYNYYYTFELDELIAGSAAGNTNFDADISPDAQVYHEGDIKGDTRVTWADKIGTLALKRAITSDILYNEALSNNCILDNEERKAVENTIKSIHEKATNMGLSVDRYTSLYYGEGMNIAGYQKMIEREILIKKYIEDYAKKCYSGFDENDVDTFYNQYATNYNTASFVVFVASYGDVAKKGMVHFNDAGNAKEVAESVYADITDTSSFLLAASKHIHAAADTDSENLMSQNDALVRNISKVSLSETSEALSEAVFSSERLVGEKLIIHDENNKTFYVVLMEKTPSRDETHPVDIRHILISLGDDEETNKSAEIKMQEVIEKWEQSTNKSEDYFAALADEYTDASDEKGGYCGVISSGTLTSEVDGWLFSGDRKCGDTKLIKTSSGYQFIYYSEKESDTAWQIAVKNDMVEQQYISYIQELENKNSNKIKTNYLAVKFLEIRNLLTAKAGYFSK